MTCLDGLFLAEQSAPFTGSCSLMSVQGRPMESELLEEIRETMERRNHILSPFSRLTDDLVRTIFKIVTTTSATSVPRFVSHTPLKFNTTGWRSPVILSHVCRRWRAIALDYAALWTDLRPSTASDLAYSEGRMSWPNPINDGKVPDGSLPDRMLVFIRRAKSSPVKVSFRMKAKVRSQSELMNEQIFSLCDNRVDSLRLEIHPSLIDPSKSLSYVSLASQSLSEFALLRHETRATNEQSDDLRWASMIEAFLQSNLPRLRRFVLHGLPLPSSCSEINALKSCHTLVLSYMPRTLRAGIATTILSMIRSAPHLQELRSSIGYHPSEPFESLNSLEGVSAEHLKAFRFVIDDSWISVLPLIEAPLLETFELENHTHSAGFLQGQGDPGDVHWLPSIQRFLANTTNLKEVRLRLRSTGIVCRLLETLPTITTLGVSPIVKAEALTECTRILDTLNGISSQIPCCLHLVNLGFQTSASLELFQQLSSFVIQRQSIPGCVAVNHIELWHAVMPGPDAPPEGPAGSPPGASGDGPEALTEAAATLAENVGDIFLGSYKLDVATRTWKYTEQWHMFDAELMARNIW